jgi:hypothetical protein
MASDVPALCLHVTLMRRAYLISKKGSEVEKPSLSVVPCDAMALMLRQQLKTYARIISKQHPVK